MDPRTTEPEVYHDWLLSQGFTEKEAFDRMLHDFLRAVRTQMNESDVSGFDDLKRDLDEVLAEDAVNRSLI